MYTPVELRLTLLGIEGRGCVVVIIVVLVIIVEIRLIDGNGREITVVLILIVGHTRYTVFPLTHVNIIVISCCSIHAET